MTQEKLEKASVVLSELKELRSARDAIKSNISMRESQLQYTSEHSPLFDWLHKCFGRFTINGNKSCIAVRAESARKVEFEVDEGFIGTVLMYLDARIEEKSKEFTDL